MLKKQMMGDREGLEVKTLWQASGDIVASFRGNCVEYVDKIK
jgi:hypothetical protein